MMAGKMNVDRSGSSTTLMAMPRARAAAETAAFTARVIGGGDGGHLAGKVAGSERGGDVREVPGGDMRGKLGVQRGGDHGDAGAGLEEPFGLAQRDLATADDQHRLVTHAQEYGQVVHGGA